MRINVGSKERFARMGMGVLSMTAAALLPVSRPVRIGLGALGAVGLATGVLRYCPVNQAIGRPFVVEEAEFELSDQQQDQPAREQISPSDAVVRGAQHGIV